MFDASGFSGTGWPAVGLKSAGSYRPGIAKKGAAKRGTASLRVHGQVTARLCKSVGDGNIWQGIDIQGSGM